MSKDTINITAQDNSQVIGKAEGQGGFYQFMMEYRNNRDSSNESKNSEDSEMKESSNGMPLSSVLPNRRRGKHVILNEKRGSFKHRGHNPLKQASLRLRSQVEQAEKERLKEKQLSETVTKLLKERYKQFFNTEWDSDSFQDVFNEIIHQLKLKHGATWHENDKVEQDLLSMGCQKWMIDIRNRKLGILNGHMDNNVLANLGNGPNNVNGRSGNGGNSGNNVSSGHSSSFQNELQRLSDKSGQYGCVRGSIMYDEAAKKAIQQMANNPKESAVLSAFLKE